MYREGWGGITFLKIISGGGGFNILVIIYQIICSSVIKNEQFLNYYI